jgi:hypothetical protein
VFQSQLCQIGIVFSHAGTEDWIVETESEDAFEVGVDGFRDIVGLANFGACVYETTGYFAILRSSGNGGTDT